MDGTSYEELKKIASYYDILEIQPLGNNAYMVRDGKVDSEEDIKNFNRTVIKLGEDLHKPVIATGDVHFTEPEDAAYRAVLPTTSRRCSSAPRRICWRSSTICPRKKPTR